MITISDVFNKMLARLCPKVPLGGSRGLVYLFVVVLLSSCLDDTCHNVVPVQHILIVYMGGDNNLSGETHQKIEAIRKGWNASAGNRLLIYQDAVDTPPCLIEIVNHNGQNMLNILKTYPKENSASAAVFARAIGEIMERYPLIPPKRVGLLVFSHGSGWLPQGTLNQPKSTAKSIIVDGNNEMDIANFANAIPKHAFDYIVFEACFMAGIEVAYELRNKTDYILASSAEILSPGFTEVYPQTINHLFDGDLSSFGQTSFDYFNNKSGNNRSATFSLIKTAELEALSRFVKNNCDMDKAITLNDVQHFDRYPYYLFFDFGDYYSRLLDNDIQKAELSALIDKCVVWKASTDSFLPYANGFDIRVHSGLTTYIPQERFPFLNAEYNKLKWNSIPIE